MQRFDDIVLLGHGSGGVMTQRLIKEIIVPCLNGGQNVEEGELDDAVEISPNGDGKLFFTTDSYVVDPFIFPGGNIGELAVNGTVNDLAMRGAFPCAISVGLILEEGLLMDDLRRVMTSMGSAAQNAGAKIVCGDTKVVPRGSCDKIFINTSGVGVAHASYDISCRGVKSGDLVLVNGTIADHGIAVTLAREGLKFESNIKSDTAPLNGIVKELIDGGVEIHALRDATRGGLATTMVEIAESSNVSIRLSETDIPMSREVKGACEVLGLDPLMVANEGKMIVIVPKQHADNALSIMRSHKFGKDSAIVGKACDSDPGRVSVTSYVGGSRLVTRLEGELLPRIC